MQALDLEKEKLILQLQKIIKNKEHHNGKRIRYDWKAAETSLINHKSLVHHERQKQILQQLLQLQVLYSSKFIPAFYSYYTILAILERNSNICEEIQQQINRTNKSENHYQNIALLILMRRKQLKEFVEKVEYSQEDVQKLRNTTILSIIKTQEWEQEFASFVDYPVFFLWEEEPYLLSLEQTVEGAFINKNQKQFLSQPNPLFLKISEKQQDIVKECLNILKLQRARSLQFSLNLPFYARNKLESPVKVQGKSNLKLQNSLNLSKRKIHSTYTNAKTIFPSISKEELNVIQKFRSLKTMKGTAKQAKPSVEYQHLFDNKIKRRIDDLKEKVKNKTQTSQIHQGSQSRHIIKEKIRKISMEKPENINNNQIVDKRPIVESLNILKEEKPKMPFLKSSSRQSLKDKRQINQQKMDNIIKQTKFLLQSRSKQQEELQAKNQSLQTLKQDLLQKVKEKTNLIKPEKPIVVKDSTKNEKYKSRQKSNQHARLKEKKQILTRVDNEKRLLEERNKSLIEQKTRIEEQFLKRYKQLTQKQKISKQISNRLSMKKLKVKNLAEKLEETKNKTIQDIENPNANIEIQKLKKKKQLQYQLEKEKIKQVQNNLENRVKEEGKRLASLQQEQSKREAQIQRQFQEQVNKLKAKHEEQQSRILQNIKQEAQKQQLYEKKIKQEEERLEYMSKEMEEWQRKQRDLQLTLRQQERKQQQKQAALRAQRKRRIDRQMEQLEQQQIQFLNKYKQTNQHLIDQLQQLKAKNHQLEQVLSFNE